MNKRKCIAILVLLTVMLLSMAVFSSTAHADGKNQTATPTPLPTATPTVAPTLTPATATKTLTPDGNLTLIDDLSGAASGDKQFITVVTKSGNYFYIIIDRASNSENVHFLNKVDEIDLMEILKEDGYEVPATPTPTPTPRPTANIEEIKTQEDGKSGSPLMFVVLLAAGGVGAYVFLKKKKATPKSAPHMEDFDYDDEEDEYESEDDESEEAPVKSPVKNRAVQKTGWDGVV